MPSSGQEIPGFGLVNYLFELSHPRLMILVLLLPTSIALASSKNVLPFGRTTADKLLACYLLLVIVLYFRETTVTDSLRQALYIFIDVYLPYYVISRSLKNVQDFRDAILSFVIAVMILSLIGIFESGKHWLLYNSLLEVLNLDSSNYYLQRSSLLRAIASSGHAIVLGYLVATAIGFFLFLKNIIPNKFHRYAGFFLLFGGLIAPLSRGPWTGAFCLFVVYFATGRRAFTRLSTMLIVGALLLLVLPVLPGGEEISDLLPFVGETEKGTITYRQKLFENSLIVIKNNPWFGSVNFLETPEMEEMRQGQGIIDIVNSYLRVALETGLVGLSLFSGFFLVICIGIYKRIRRLPDKLSIEHLLGRSLLATLTCVLLIIFTVSSISFIPLIYWSVAGLGVAYIQMIDQSTIDIRTASLEKQV